MKKIAQSKDTEAETYFARARLVDAAPAEQLIEVRRQVWQCVVVCCSAWQRVAV